MSNDWSRGRQARPPGMDPYPFADAAPTGILIGSRSSAMPTDLPPVAGQEQLGRYGAGMRAFMLAVGILFALTFGFVGSLSCAKWAPRGAPGLPWARCSSPRCSWHLPSTGSC